MKEIDKLLDKVFTDEFEARLKTMPFDLAVKEILRRIPDFGESAAKQTVGLIQGTFKGDVVFIEEEKEEIEEYVKVLAQ